MDELKNEIQPINRFSLYGDSNVFKKRLSEGYTEASFGSGEWILGEFDDYRIVRLWVFYHPQGKRATYEHPKGRDYTLMTHRGFPFEAEYSPQEFEEYCKRLKIKVSPQESLPKLLEECLAKS